VEAKKSDFGLFLAASGVFKINSGIYQTEKSSIDSGSHVKFLLAIL
jgi:hypothetical protein